MAVLSPTVNQIDLFDIYRTAHPTTACCTFFSSSYRTFTKTEYILAHKTHLDKLKGQKSKKICSHSIMQLK
jgi:hypothetical protein